MRGGSSLITVGLNLITRGQTQTVGGLSLKRVGLNLTEGGQNKMMGGSGPKTVGLGQVQRQRSLIIFSGLRIPAPPALRALWKSARGEAAQTSAAGHAGGGAVP